MEATEIGFPRFGGIELWREEVIVQLYFAGQGFQSCPTLTVNQLTELM